MIHFANLYVFFYGYFRSVLKWFLRKTTKLCELQRICYGKPVGAQRSSAVEYSLYNSKQEGIRTVIAALSDAANSLRLKGRGQKLVLETSVKAVIVVKEINPETHRRFVTSFTRCLEHIWGYQQLYAEIEALRLTQYDSGNAAHEEKLDRLWRALVPQVPLETRITKQWQDIGFQGDDPKTDFRGMGLLGLDNLLFFAEEYRDAAHHVLSHSLHPKHGYAFAIVGINITSMAYHLLKDGSAKTHIYNNCKSLPSLRAFHQLYCYLFYEFDRFWLESKPEDVMQFSFIKDKFEQNIRDLLKDPSTVFKTNFTVTVI